VDELVGGTRAAAWPLIRDDLGLSYTQVGLVLALPGFFGSALDPLIGTLGDTHRRRALLLAGGIAFAASAALTSVAGGFATLLLALLLGNPATGAFVSLTQATLMEAEPDRRQLNMARWTLAGSLGYVGGPILLAGAVAIGLGWRGILGALAVVALPLAVATRTLPAARAGGASLRESMVYAAVALRRREVLRWLAVLEAADLLLDVLHGFLALYFVDVLDVQPASAALAVATWTAAGLAGDVALLPLLRRAEGTRYLRLSAKLVLLAVLGLLNSGWYAIPKAGLYGSLEGRGGATVAVGGIGGLIGAAVPLVLGVVAGAAGLASTMWLLTLAPLVLVVLVPRR